MSDTVKSRQSASLHTPTDLGDNARHDIAGALTALVADYFALYIKTKNFHWHVSGPHFISIHEMLDDQATDILAAIDPLAERVRKLGGHTLRSIGQAATMTRISDNNAEFVTAEDMLAELREDNIALVRSLRTAHDLCNEHRDSASTSLIENFIDEAEKRTWFLFEMGRRSEHG
jgi:starvation-inducible DNA-binding protein